jgi:hypothetical protein
MKHLLRLFILAALPVTTLHAQMNLDYFGFHASSAQSVYAGWGGGMNMISSPIGLKAKSGFCPVKMQLGGGMYFAGAGQGEIDGVTMQDEKMNITFSNTQLGGYGLARFTIPSAGKFLSPYLDMFAGMRIGISSMTKHPETLEEHEECETVTLDRSFGFSGGVGTGVLIPLSKNMKLDVGMQWHGTTTTGKFIDMKSVVNTGDGISYNMKNTPNEMLFVKVGLQLRIANDGCCGFPGCTIPEHHMNACEHAGRK